MKQLLALANVVVLLSHSVYGQKAAIRPEFEVAAIKQNKSGVRKSTAISYDPESKPLSLVLYSERNSPPWDVLQPLIEEKRSEIGVSFDPSGFDHFWLYLAQEERIPFSLSKNNIFTAHR